MVVYTHEEFMKMIEEKKNPKKEKKTPSPDEVTSAKSVAIDGEPIKPKNKEVKKK